jgi:hypothetical protein
LITKLKKQLATLFPATCFWGFRSRVSIIQKHKMATPFCVFKTLTGFGF